MKRAAYRPLAGTVAAAAIDHMKKLDQVNQGWELSTHALAQAIGQEAGNFGQYLAAAVRADMLRRRVDGGMIFWSLGRNSDFDAPPAALSPADQDGARLVSVSVTATPSVFAYAAERNAAPFSTALSTDGRLTVERHGRAVFEFTDAERRLLLKSAEAVKAPL